MLEVSLRDDSFVPGPAIFKYMSNYPAKACGDTIFSVLADHFLQRKTTPK